MDKLYYQIEMKNNRDIPHRAFNTFFFFFDWALFLLFFFFFRQFLFCTFVYKCNWEKTNQKPLAFLFPGDTD